MSSHVVDYLAIIGQHSHIEGEEKEGDQKTDTFKSENYEGIEYVSCLNMCLPVL